MANYRITIVMINGDQITRNIIITPRQLRKALRDARNGCNVLFEGTEDTYLIFGGQISRILAVQEK